MIEAGSDLAQLEAELQVNPICPPYHTALPERIGSDCLIEKDVICRSDACLVVDRPTRYPAIFPPTPAGYFLVSAESMISSSSRSLIRTIGYSLIPPSE